MIENIYIYIYMYIEFIVLEVLFLEISIRIIHFCNEKYFDLILTISDDE